MGLLRLAGTAPSGQGPSCLIRYLIDSSALWRTPREGRLRTAWTEVISVVMICATAALRGLVVLHDDKDFTTAAQRLTDLDERRIGAEPPPA